MKLCMEALVRLSLSELLADADSSICDRVAEAVLRLIQRLRAWPIPRNYAARDWKNELRQVAFQAVGEALRDRNSHGHVDLAAWVYERALGKARDYYRDEWNFTSHCTGFASNETSQVLEDFPPELANFAAPDSRPDHIAGQAEVPVAVAGLPEPYRALILRMFWEDATEVELAARMRVTQSGVSRRKTLALKLLRRRL